MAESDAGNLSIRRYHTRCVSHPDAILDALRRMKLIDATARPRLMPLPGGVSSDIWRVDLPTGPVCVKRALPRLKVAACWEAPVRRNGFEWAWMQEAERIVPGSVPPLVGQDEGAGCFAMEFLDPAEHPLWKTQLRDGHVRATTARAVGERLAAIHAATAGRDDLAARFRTEDIFFAIRLEPYLLATAERHTEVAAPLRALAKETADTRRALVHGDVSPKNILVGPNGPVFLDAECAWYGDPAFDLAFCLNHLLLKCLWTPPATGRFLAAFDTLAASYLESVDWEPRAALERRAAHLLPGLFLARVDGKSPVEYINTEADRDLVRRTACRFLAQPASRLAPVRAEWADALEASR